MEPEDGAEDFPARESRRIALLLAARCRDAGRSIRSIERELALGSGTLSGQIAGRTRLRFPDLIATLQAIGVAPGEFFAEAYPPAAPHATKGGTPNPSPQGHRPAIDQATADRAHKAVNAALARMESRLREIAREEIERAREETETPPDERLAPTTK